MGTEQQDASITATENGPLVVKGGVPLYRRHIVETEGGEPVTWETRAQLETRDTYSLCRCGHSANKPFCDGTHAKIGFIADDIDTGAYADRADAVGGTRIVVRYDESICVHAGFCGNDTTSVWKLAKTADENGNDRIDMVGMIEHCPSGALTYTIEGEDQPNEQLLPTAIGVVDDGPLAVSNGVPVSLANGDTLEVRNRCTLCRCGASTHKPLCDGTHKEIGFTDS